ncbi:molecular chaperone [Salmonella enterica subsp. salamae]|nr:molecular chaperone [Salmonella enterica subsp. salamae]EDW4022798.1 fimbria/pilus periplasmic chaperone [Salmonella enterica subsp. salamae]
MRHMIKGVVVIVGVLSSAVTMAAGMVPETSLLLVNEEEHGASMDVKNTDEQAQLLYTKIVNLPDDTTGPELIVTQPVVRLEAGKIQRVRFVLKDAAQKTNVEHLKRVIFSAIPQVEKNKVKMLFTQNLPVIIRPAGLAPMADPWKDLRWSINAGKVVVKNDTPYVVRLEQTLKVLPSGNIQKIKKSYILPGQTLTAEPQKIAASATDNKVEFYPATRYGYKVDKFVAEIIK